MFAFLLRRFRWMLVGAGVRYVARRGVGRSVDEATAVLEEKLPAPVVKAANVLPGDVLRAGGAAAVAGRAARRTGGAVHRTGAVVHRTSGAAARSVSAVRPRVRQRWDGVRSAIETESDRARRELKSDYARHTEGEGAALEALLDLRDVEADPIPDVPDEVGRGRRRFLPPLPSPPVARVQRTYRPPQKPWDRGRRGR